MEVKSNRTLTIVVIAVVWLATAFIIAIQFWPVLPQTFPEWILFIVFGPPLYVLASALGEWLFSEIHGRALSRYQFSGLRIVVALVAVLCILGLITAGVWVLTGT